MRKAEQWEHIQRVMRQTMCCIATCAFLGAVGGFILPVIGSIIGAFRGGFVGLVIAPLIIPIIYTRDMPKVWMCMWCVPMMICVLCVLGVWLAWGLEQVGAMQDSILFYRGAQLVMLWGGVASLVGTAGYLWLALPPEWPPPLKGQCQSCGFSLDGLDTDDLKTCPECGRHPDGREGPC